MSLPRLWSQTNFAWKKDLVKAGINPNSGLRTDLTVVSHRRRSVNLIPRLSHTFLSCLFANFNINTQSSHNISDINLNQNNPDDQTQSDEEIEMSDQRIEQANFFTKFFTFLSCTVCGVVFGIAVEKAKVYDPFIIEGQMLFEKFTMLKMFLSASATSMLVFCILDCLPITNRKMNRATKRFVSALAEKSVGSSLVGGMILGVGMTLAGSCPGMVFAQLGASVPNSGYTYLGGLVGALLFATCVDKIKELFSPKRKLKFYTLPDALNMPYIMLAVPISLLLGLVVLGIESFRQWDQDVVQSGSELLSMRAWPPHLSGLLVGLLQLPLILLISDTLGSSSSYMTVAAQIPALTYFCPCLSKFQSSVKNWWQVSYVCGIVMGAYTSSQLSGIRGSIAGVPPVQAFSGGVLLIFGSRLAGGCTSGHGLSGMAMLSLLSMVAVPAMFTGGIATAFIMKYYIK